jgi:hypothetical protein
LVEVKVEKSTFFLLFSDVFKSVAFIIFSF